MSVDWFKTRVLQGGGNSKNLTLEITGCLDDKSQTSVVYEFEGARLVKLASAMWMIEEKAGLRLWWGTTGLLVPMESRNSARFDLPIPSPEGWNRALILAPRKVTELHYFSLTLDFDL